MIELQLLFVLLSKLFGPITWFKLLGYPTECDIVLFCLFFLVKVSLSYLLNLSPLPEFEKSNMGGAMIRLSRGFVTSYIEAIIDEISSRNIISMTYNFLNSEIGITLGAGPDPKQRHENWYSWSFLLNFLYF